MVYPNRDRDNRVTDNDRPERAPLPIPRSRPANQVSPPPSTTHAGSSKPIRSFNDDYNSNRGGGGGGGDDRRMSMKRMSRSRSRSPEYDDRRKRRRSRSGSPRRDNYGHSRDSRREPSPSFDSPDSLPYRVTFRYFTDYFRKTQPSLINSSSSALEEAFAAYKIDFYRRQLVNVFEDQKRYAWFKERYEPGKEAEEARKVTRDKGREGKMAVFLDKFGRGEWDDLCLDRAPEVVEAPAVETGKDEEVLKSVEGEDVEMLRVREDADESIATSTAVTKPARGITSDTYTLPNSKHQLFIKLLSVNLSRKSLEEHCSKAVGFDYLAISLPNPMAKYSRVGYVQFKEDTDLAAAMELLCESKVDKFQLHMAPTLVPSSQRVNFAPSLVNTSERLAKDLERASTLATLYEKDLGDARGSVVIEEKRLALLAEANLSSDDKGEAKDNLNKTILDLYIVYLRSVFNTCYYCAATHDFPEELNRSCVLHGRRAVTKNEGVPSTYDARWETKFEEKIKLLLGKDINPVEHGGESYDDELHKLCEKNIKLEDAGKFRCKECLKLFSALKFIEKHISSKHPEVLGDSLERVHFFNNFVLDPLHVLPPELSTGNVPMRRPPPQNQTQHQVGGGSRPDQNRRYHDDMTNQRLDQPLRDGLSSSYNRNDIGNNNSNYNNNNNNHNNGFNDRRRRSSPGPGQGFNNGNGNGNGNGNNRNDFHRPSLSDRIGERMFDDSPPLAPRRQNRPPRIEEFEMVNHTSKISGPLPPPPVGVQIDPRARKGVSSYADLDAAPSGAASDDIVLNY